jgi:hypothetical protein
VKKQPHPNIKALATLILTEGNEVNKGSAPNPKQQKSSFPLFPSVNPINKNEKTN